MRRFRQGQGGSCVTQDPWKRFPLAETTQRWGLCNAGIYNEGSVVEVGQTRNEAQVPFESIAGLCLIGPAEHFQTQFNLKT